MRNWSRGFVLALCGLLPLYPFVSALADAPQGSEGTDFIIRVQPGDTLIGLAAKYCDRVDRWNALQTLNHIADPWHLKPGTTLRIPLAFIEETPSFAHVVSQTPGTVIGYPPDRIPEHAHIKTDETQSITLELGDGTRVVLPPDSDMTIARLRQFAKSKLLDAQINLPAGSVESSVDPDKHGVGRYEIQTPRTVSGVRGTRFYIGSTPDRSVNAVFEGRVQVRAGGTRMSLLAAQGMSVSRGRLQTEHLMGAPSAQSLPAKLERFPARINLAADGSEDSRFSLEIARDERFTELLWASAHPALSFQIPAIPDGQYHWRLRRISALGIPGESTDAPVTVKANPPPPFVLAPAPGGAVWGSADLQWATVPDIDKYEIEIAADEPFTDVKKRSSLPGNSTGSTVSLALGNYWWRIRSVAKAGALMDAGPWSLGAAFHVRPALPAVALGATDGDGVSLHWDAEPDTRYNVQLSSTENFSTIAYHADVVGSSVSVPELPPGRYYVRMQAAPNDGQQSPFSKPQSIFLPATLKTMDGPVRASGNRVRIQ
jgi:hypothetical protein